MVQYSSGSKIGWKILSKRIKQGKLVLNGIILEKHEMATIGQLLWYARKIELLLPSLTPYSKNADFIMDGVVWEMKCPQGNGKSTIEHIFKKGAKQSANLLIDLRRFRGQEETALNVLRLRFRKSGRVKRLLVLTKSHQLLDFVK